MSEEKNKSILSMGNDNDPVRRSISATLAEIQQSPCQLHHTVEIKEALEIIQRIEVKLNKIWKKP
jgi:hypothetical protein